MTAKALLLAAAALAVACFVPPVHRPEKPEVRSIDAKGVDARCLPEEARVEMPPRDAVTALAPLHDLAYAAAAAGPEGCVWVLAATVLVAVLLGLWSHSIRGALRHAVLVVSLGTPACLALLYTSCLLDGQVIRIGPVWADKVPASLHNHTDRSTGLLSPRELVIWHVRRGFRVLNVSDKDTIRGGIDAREALARLVADRGPIVPPLLVTVGDEWHGQPDIVFVNTTTEPQPPPPPKPGLSREERHAHRLRYLAELATKVHEEKGALFLAHPWSKVPAEMSLEEIFAAGLDGVEVVNGVIHGGEARISAAVLAGKPVFGVIDYKFGPHVHALTLLDEKLARTPEGVARAVREGATRVVYAVPGGARSSEEWKAAAVGLRGVLEGYDALREAPAPRRWIWFAWGVFGLLLWWLSTRGRRGLGKAAARTLFIACAVGELALLLFVWSEVRFTLGTVAVPVLLRGAGVLAVPLLAANHSLAILERQR